MKINADFSQRVVVHASKMDWIPSPMPGVERRMLDRIGDEVARATTIVRYAPGSAFSAHAHDGGEEYVVLEGVFSDEHGDFPAGTYVRNPPTSSHSPSSKSGAVIFVKLHQFDPDDRTHVCIATDKTTPVPVANRDGVRVVPLFSDAHEDVRIEHWEAGATVDTEVRGGLEVFVIEGSFVEGDDELIAHSWLRLPSRTTLNAVAGPSGAKVWVKSGHLDHV